MSKPRVVIVAPNAFERFLGASWENQFQLMTRSGHLASIQNLDILINGRAKRAPVLDKGWKATNPMAGYYLESFLRQRGYATETVFDWTNDEVLLEAMAIDPIVVVLSTTYITDDWLLAECIRSLRAVIGEVPLVVGGPYIWKQKMELSRKSELTQLRRRADATANRSTSVGGLFGTTGNSAVRDAIYVAQEFGERSLIRLIDAFERGDRDAETWMGLPNLVLAMPDGSWFATPSEDEAIDLDVDYTRWDLVDEVPSLVPVRTSVGCPYRCRYCDFIALHPKVLMRSPASLLAEIRLAQARGRNVFNFIDDNIFLSKKRIGQLTSAILDNEMDIVWSGFFRVDRVDETNIDDIWRSGCRFGMCGIESGDNEMLKRMRKGCDLDEIRRGIELSTDRGLLLLLTFILGYPGETRESIDGTIDFVNGLSATNRGYSSYQAYPFYLLPNTAVDAPEYRAQFDLTGSHEEWSHATMTSQEVVNNWAPYFFKRITSLPYQYYVNDFPFGWTVERRNRAFEARRQLTASFIDNASEAEIQSRFADLFRVVDERGGDVSAWNGMLAERSLQPGARRPRARLGG